MHIYERGAILSNSKNDISLELTVLVADIFELNTDLKAMIVADVDYFNYDFTSDDKTLEYMKLVLECDTFECNATALGNNFRCIFKNCIIDADYGNGSIVRFYLEVEDYEHHECRVTENHHDSMIETMKKLTDK